MVRKILFVTTDQQRYDALGCNGGRIARTPAIDALAAEGIRYERAHCQNVVCMPSRSTMLTGQYVRTHGVTMNGVPLPADAPSVAAYLHDKGGYRTALIGKAHFEPALDFGQVFPENRLGRDGQFGPHRGFEHMELAMHGAIGPWHYPVWLRNNFPNDVPNFYQVIVPGPDQNIAGGGETGAVQVKHNPVAREHYHTDWVAARTIAYLDSLPADADWFVWMSFPDPHHPWDPPEAEVGRVKWRDLDLPEGYPGSREQAAAILKDKPRHWLDWFEGRLVSNFEAPSKFVPAALTVDQIREINARVHVKNELIDEALARVVQRIGQRGSLDDTDILFTTDHGEFQGDFGLLFKGPYHVDALMRLPLIWRPAPSAGIAAAAVAAPVGHVDLAPTFCAIAGLPVPAWMQGKPLPTSARDATAQRRERVFTEWDSDINDVHLHLRTLYRDGYVCTIYEPGTLHDGSEGELYDLNDDPLQRRNRWSDPAYGKRRSDLVADLRDSMPPARTEPLKRVTLV
ncbi:MAG TPA: sulfatase-like hydrolase/transferase [Candidatus Cybelea sp.]|nr:sulfatase-like hydrolase/transferase [Candidatus Cybelea sp.]